MNYEWEWKPSACHEADREPAKSLGSDPAE